MSNNIHKFNYDDDETGHMLFEEMRSLNKSSQAKHELVDNDSSIDRKYIKCPEHDTLKRKVEGYAKKFQALENMLNDAIKDNPKYIQTKIESLSIDMDIIKIQLARIKFYQLLALVFVLVSVCVGCMIYKKVLDEDYKMFGKIYREVPIDIP